MKIFSLLFIFLVTPNLCLTAQENTNQNKFQQLKQEFATPNVYRTASGAPGHEYWQQKADYKIDIRLDDEKQRISGVETITYFNQSPDVLKYIWLQLDQNRRAKDSDTHKISSTGRNSIKFTRDPRDSVCIQRPCSSARGLYPLRCPNK